MDHKKTQSANFSFSGPAWNIESIYPSLSSSQLKNDWEDLNKILQGLFPLSQELVLEIEKGQNFSSEVESLLQRMKEQGDQVRELLENLLTYAQCHLSVDGSNEEAKKLLSKTQEAEAKLAEWFRPWEIFMMRVSEDFVERFLSKKANQSCAFYLRHLRSQKDFLLSLPEEQLLEALNTNGFRAWGLLYDEITGRLKCSLASEGEVGLAYTSNLLRGHQEEKRKEAYQAIAKTFSTQEVVCSSILNSLAGTRLQIYEKRSRKVPMHFLEAPLHQARIKKQTLEAMLEAVHAFKDVGRKALLLQAKAMGKKQADPWDLLASAPDLSQVPPVQYSFAQAIQMIQAAFSRLDPEMGDFVSLMEKNQWIEGRAEGNKRPGAYCTSFAVAREPRVYMTYNGSMNNVITLAHELGHAFHFWKMRDLSFYERQYPMTLAETASLMAQTAVNDYLLQEAKSPTDLYFALWNEAQEAHTMLLNLPARFHFEKTFYEQRKERTFSVQDFKNLMKDSWRHYYGEALSQMDEMFWASKLHFHLTDISFYNFPYTFGYLFSLGIWGHQNHSPGNFYSSYVNLLRDTGRMGVEELVKKHLHEDTTRPEFWIKALQMVKKKVDHFEGVVNELLIKK